MTTPIADAARVIAWAHETPRRPAQTAFTAGPERQAAYWIEWAQEVEREKLEWQCQRMRQALHDIAEEWAGAECGEPVNAQEAYAIGLAKRMYVLAQEGLWPQFFDTK